MCLNPRIALLCMLLHMQLAGAAVIHQSRPLQESIADAHVVAQVRISKIEERQFSDGSGPASCGTDYVVDVLTTFKGERRTKRTFSVLGEPHAILFHEVKPGDEMLVLLIPRQKGETPEGEATDVIRAAPSLAEIECRARLSATTLLRGEAGGFPLIVRPKTPAVGEKDVVWIAYSGLTEMSQSLMRDQVPYDPNCKGPECYRASRRMVPWQPLRAEIQRWVREAEQSGPAKIDRAR